MEFDKESHTYFNDDGEAMISVTQLLEKHGLAPDYGDVDESILKAKARRGSLIHEEIANYLMNGEAYFSEECDSVARAVEDNDFEDVSCEVMVSNGKIAGTYDCLATVNGIRTLIDWKTTASYDPVYLSWQLSLYDYLGKLNCGKLMCVQLKGSEITFHEVKRHSDEEIERLLDCEEKGVPFISDQTQLSEDMGKSDLMIKLEEAENVILFHKKAMEEAQKDEARIKAELIKQMEEKGVKTIKTEKLSITYVAPVKREILDSDKLKRENPSIYDQYKKQSLTKASVRIAERKQDEPNKPDRAID